MTERRNPLLFRITGTVLTLLAFLLPLKFGGLAVMPEAGGFYPAEWSSWFVVTFPPHSLGLISGAVLALTLASARISTARPAGFILLWCVLPTLAALPGLRHGWSDESWGEVSNLLGIGAFVAAAALQTAADVRWGRRFAGAFLLGGMFCAVYGVYQFCWGMDELRAFTAEQIAAGADIPEAIRRKLADPRIFSTMASCNALTSLMLMLVPPAWFWAGEWGRKFTPEAVSRRVFRAVLFGLILLNLIFAASRGALFCLVGAGVLAVFSLPGPRPGLRLTALALALAILGSGLLFAVRYGRGLGSMTERADYLRTAAILTAEHPLTGGGWGEFFRRHMTIKYSDIGESARDPHNVVAAFASQAGVLSGMAMLAVLLVPPAGLWKRRFAPGFPAAVFWSGVLFTLHSLLDCDWHVPALPAAMGMLYAAAWAETDDAPTLLRRRDNFALKLLLAALALAAAGSNLHYLRGDMALAQLNDRLHPASAEQAAAVAKWDVAALFRRAESLRPRSAVIRQMKGDWRWRNADLSGAEACYFQALALDPRRPGAWARLAQLAAVRGDRAEAYRRMRRAQEIFPKNPRYDADKFMAEVKR
ncbi:MAG: hypothetical protein MR051_09755 [Lentisphaeria bacterium]|nr:hypothetical protein [Lentisphaeria bacterium]